MSVNQKVRTLPCLSIRRNTLSCSIHLRSYSTSTRGFLNPPNVHRVPIHPCFSNFRTKPAFLRGSTTWIYSYVDTSRDLCAWLRICSRIQSSSNLTVLNLHTFSSIQEYAAHKKLVSTWCIYFDSNIPRIIFRIQMKESLSTTAAAAVIAMLALAPAQSSAKVYSQSELALTTARWKRFHSCRSRWVQPWQNRS